MAALICQGCGSELADDSRFCPTCGKEVAVRICQACGAPIPEGSSFCPSCGKGTAAQVCQSCGAPIPEGSSFCPSCGKGTAAHVCESCGAPIPEGSRLCLSCEEKEAARQAQEAALLAEKKAEALAREKARQEVEEAKKAAVAPPPEKREGVFVSSSSRRPLRGWHIAGGIVLLLALAGVVYVFTFGRSTPAQDKTTTTTNETTTPLITTTTTNETTTPLITTTTTNETTTPSITTITPSQTLAEVLARTAEIVSVKYDALVTRPLRPAMTMKTWVKKNKVRIERTEEGESVVILFNGDEQTVYRYVPGQNTATKMPYPPPTKTAVQDAESITKYNPEVVGTETIDGKACLVVEYFVSGAPAKMWLWQDYGFPLRMEMTVPAGITVFESSNIDFADIPDSVFELPPGVRVIKSGSNPPP